MAGGEGMSGAAGIAGFPNGETFRMGTVKPVLYLARAYLGFIIPVDPGKQWVDDDANTIGTMMPKKYIAIYAGKLSLGDFFDNNSYSYDLREQFLNWSLMSAGVYDYAAMYGTILIHLSLNIFSPDWETRAVTALLLKEANGANPDWKYSKSFSWQAEIARKWNDSLSNTTAIRFITFFNRSLMSNYKLALNYFTPDLITTRMYSRNK